MPSCPRIRLLGVPIDAVTRHEAVCLLLEMLAGTGQHHVMTPNSEMLVRAWRDAAFREVLRGTALNLPDSAGLLLAARMTGQSLPARVTGVDTAAALCARLSADVPVYLLGGAPGIAERAGIALRQANPRLCIAGMYAGSPSLQEAPAIIERINRSGARLLLVAYGAPAQDFWIAEHLVALPAVRVAVGVGGTFDFLAGNRRRAPVLLRRSGLEWSWRLLQEPHRFMRIWRAVVVFPLLVCRHGRGARCHR